MKCLKCGADTSVLETRLHLGIFTRRSRMCFNNHRSVTYEVPAGALDKRQLKSAVVGQAVRKIAERRKQTVLRHPAKSAASLALQLGITDARVRQIRAETR